MWAPVDEDQGPIRPRSQGQQVGLLLLEAIQRPLLEGAVLPDVGHGLEPVLGLMVQIRVGGEGAAVEEALPQVADRPLHLALGFGPVGPTGSCPEAPMMGEPEELCVLDQGTAIVAQVLHNDGLHLVEESLRRHTSEGFKGSLKAPEQGAHVLLGIEPKPEEAGVAENDEKSIASTPGQTKMGKVHLGLVARRGLKADDRIKGRVRTNLPGISLHEVVATRVASGQDLFKEPFGRELRELSQPGSDQGLVGIELGGPPLTGPVLDGQLIHGSVQLSGLDPVIHGTPVDAQFPGNGGLTQSLFKVVTKQHTLLPSDHRASTGLRRR